jgi:hypothetical protein
MATTTETVDSKVETQEKAATVGPPVAALPADGVDRQDEEPTEYPNMAKTLVIMASLYISIFLVALDRTILGTAIPRITDQFHSIDDIGWYGSAYMLTGKKLPRLTSSRLSKTNNSQHAASSCFTAEYTLSSLLNGSFYLALFSSRLDLQFVVPHQIPSRSSSVEQSPDSVLAASSPAQFRSC